RDEPADLVDRPTEAGTGPRPSGDLEGALCQRIPTGELVWWPLGQHVGVRGRDDHVPSPESSMISLRSSALGRITVKRMSIRRFAARSASVSCVSVAGRVSA